MNCPEVRDTDLQTVIS